MNRFLIGCLICLICATNAARADTIEMINGDRYSGTVLSLDKTKAVLQSDIQGQITIDRSKISAIFFKNPAGDSKAGKATSIRIESPASEKDLVAQLREQGAQSDLIKGVQRQLLQGATPDANQMFSNTVRGLIQGRISVEDVRKQAQNSVQQIKDAKLDLGEDMGGLLDGYLRILESFLATTRPTPTPTPHPEK